MYIDLLVPPYTIPKATTFYADVVNNQNPFPLMSVDIDSYSVTKNKLNDARLRCLYENA
jgi:hypothetical protein